MKRVSMSIITTFTTTIDIDINQYQEDALEEICDYGPGIINVDNEQTPAEEEVADMLCRNIQMDNWNSLKFQVKQKEVYER